MKRINASLPNDVWVPVVGFEDSHEVSDRGEVRSKGYPVRYAKKGPGYRKGQALTQWEGSDGTMSVQLSRGGLRYPVHYLVLISFVDTAQCLYGGIRHINGFVFDNRLVNLEWSQAWNAASCKPFRAKRKRKEVKEVHALLGSEEWRPVKGRSETHEVSDTGYVRATKGNRAFLKASSERSRRLRVRFEVGGKMTYVHQVVMEAFVPNPHGFRYAKHLNGSVLDNRAKNLEWTDDPNFAPCKEFWEESAVENDRLRELVELQGGEGTVRVGRKGS